MNAVSPGPVDTPILKDFLETLGARAEEDRKVMDRPGAAADVAPVIMVLLSDMTTCIRMRSPAPRKPWANARSSAMNCAI